MVPPIDSRRYASYNYRNLLSALRASQFVVFLLASFRPFCLPYLPQQSTYSQHPPDAIFLPLHNHVYQHPPLLCYDFVHFLIGSSFRLANFSVLPTITSPMHSVVWYPVSSIFKFPLHTTPRST